MSPILALGARSSRFMSGLTSYLNRKLVGLVSLIGRTFRAAVGVALKLRESHLETTLKVAGTLAAIAASARISVHLGLNPTFVQRGAR